MRHEGAIPFHEHGDGCRKAAGCRGCTGCDSPPPEVPYSGTAVVGGALGLFVVPVLLAVGGAWLGGGNASAQLAGGAGGLATGMVLAWLGHRVLDRKKKEGGR